MMFLHIVGLIMLTAATQPPERVLNLGRPVANPNATSARQFRYEGACAGGRGASGRMAAPPEFRVAIERLDRDVYSMGTQIFTDILLTNSGNRALWFPWVRADEFGDGFGGEDAIQVGIGILMVDQSGREHGLSGTVLRGSPRKARTMQAIAPGETIRIRLPLWISIVDSPDAPPSGEAQLFVKLNFNDGECRTWDPVQSPAVPIRFKGRE